MRLADILAPIGSVLVLGIYQLIVSRQGERPEVLARSFVAASRRAWVRMVMGGKDILAVQTFRNMIMAANFFASTAFLVALGLVSFTAASEGVPTIINRLNYYGSTDQSFFMVKALVLVVVFFATFFNFALTIRYYNHVAIIINAPTDDPAGTEDRVIALMDRGASHQMWGMRGFYYAVPLVLWFFGPMWLFGGSLLLVPLLYVHDHLP